jgi:hypothetical protein
MAKQQIKSAQLAPSKTTDANGWTIYDYGAFKKYCLLSAQSSINVNAADRASFATFNLPVGMSNINNVYVQAQMVGGTWVGVFFLGIQGNAGTISGFLGNNYNGATLATGAFSIYVELTDI